MVTEIYEQWGTYVMFGTVTATLAISLVMTLVAYASLVPSHGTDEKVTWVPEVIVNGDTTGGDKNGEIGRRLPVYTEEEEQDN